jgi:tape measure domain-containing protein
MSGVEIRVRAHARQAQNEIRKTGQSLKGLETQAASITKTFQRMALGFGAIFAAQGVTRGINSASDAMVSLGNRVRLVTKDTQKTNATIKELFNIAARSGGSIDAAAETFNRFGLALRDADKPVAELLKVTEAVQKAAVISGSGAESAKAAIVQLGQGLASGQLRGQELNSVLEQMPRLAQAIAEGMKIPFGKLREEAMAGRVTAEAVYDSLLSGAEKINEEFKTLKFTTGEFATVMKNELTRAISEFDKVAGFSDAFKNKIILLTKAFRYVGENIARWALNTQLAFLIVESQAKDFFHGFLNLFNADFDGETMGRNMVAAVKRAIEDVKAFANQKIKLAIEFSVEKYDLIGRMFPEGDSNILGTLKTFATNVINVFKGIWAAIVGNSWWTSIFLTGHSESTEGTIGNTAGWGKGLKSASAHISKWANSISTYFSDLYFEVIDTWQLMMQDIATLGPEEGVRKNITEPLANSFQESFTKIKRGWTDLSAFIGQKLLGTETTFNEFGDEVKVTTTFGKSFESALDNMKIKWNNFSYETFARTGIDIPLTDEIKKSFDDSMFAVIKTWKFALGVIKGSPIGVAATVAFDFIGDNAKAIKDSIDGFFADNSHLFTVAFTGGMALAFRAGLRAVAWKTILVSSIVSGLGTLGTNSEFQDSVYRAAVDWGKTFKDLITGNGDVIANIGEGLANVFSAVGEGFIDGLFGKDFESSFAEGAATAITAALTALLIMPTFTIGAAKLGLSLVGQVFSVSAVSKYAGLAATMFGDILLKTSKKGRLYTATAELGAKVAAMTFAPSNMTGVSSAFANGLKDAGRSKAVLGAAATLGSKIIGGLGLGYISREIGNALKSAFGFDGIEISYDEFGDEIRTSSMGNALFTIFNDAIAGAILGFTVGGPWGALALALGGALLGIFMSEEQKNGIINMFHVVKDAVLEGLTNAWDAFTAYASDWTPDWLKDLFSAKEGFGGSQEFEANNSQLPASFAGYAQQPGETDSEYRKRAQKFNTGGYVSGAGTGTSDDIPAMLSNGEYVIKAAAVNKLGKGKLDLLNQGILPKFATGGIVGAAQREIKDSFNRGDVSLAMEMISVVEQLGKLDETMAGLTDEMKKEVKKVTGGRSEEEQDQIDDLEANFNGTLSNAISSVLHGGDWKDVLTGLLDTVTSTIINKFADGMAEGITKNIDFGSMFDGLGDLFGMGESAGGGSGIGSLLSTGLGFFGFSQGGTVPSTPFSQAGKDSVPAMLMPGEVVLSKNDVNNMGSNQGGSTQAFNINVSGDVSRQTRKEIVKMMPQIAGGVNAQNKESNYRR